MYLFIIKNSTASEVKFNINEHLLSIIYQFKKGLQILNTPYLQVIIFTSVKWKIM